MRIYSESRLSPATQEEPPLDIGSVLVPRGSSVGGMVDNKLLNRIGTYFDLSAGVIRPREQWALDDRNNSNPPRRPALDAVVWLVKNRQAMGLPRVTHLFVDFEDHADDRDGYESLAASYYLRARLPREYLVTTYSRWAGTPDRVRPFFENDDAAAYTLYAWNRVIMAKDPVDEWMRMVAEYEDEVESVEPDKPRVAFVTPRVQVWWPNDPQYADIRPLNNTLLTLDFWRTMKERLRKPPRRNGRDYRPWDLFVFGPYDTDLSAHMDAMIPPKR